MSAVSVEGKATGLSNLTRRVLFAIAAIPLVVGAVWYGGWALAALLAIASAVGAWELYRIARAAGYTPLAGPGIVLAGMVPLAVHARYLGLADGTRGVTLPESIAPVARLFVGIFTLSFTGAAVIALAILGATIWTRGVSGRPLGAAALTIFGVLYTGMMLSFAYATRYHDYAVGPKAGAALLILTLAIVWISDTAGYFVGRAIGRRKLIPSVSPGKTVAGALGAIVFSAIAAALYVPLALEPWARLGMRPAMALVFGAVISTATQVGDLAESLIKREAGVKDSSTILPGHGGVLDRVDGLLFALPVAYWLYGQLLVPVPA